MSSSTVLVTGASGFVGTRLIDRLCREQGATVRAGVRRFGGAANVARFPVEFALLGSFGARELDSALIGCDVVYHCAQNWDEPAANPEMATALVTGMARHGVRRIVYLSSLAAYYPVSHAGPITEDRPLGPTPWDYATSKRATSAALLQAAQEHGVEATVLEPPCVYGPFSVPFAIVPAHELRCGRVVVPPADEGVCNLLYIDDLIDAMISAATAPGAVGERFIVSADAASWGELYRAVAGAIGAGEVVEMAGAEVDRLIATPGPKGAARRLAANPRAVLTSRALAPVRAVARRVLGGVRWEQARASGPPGLVLPVPEQREFRWCGSVASADKAARVLGFAPQVSVATGLERTAAFVRWAGL